MDSLPLLRTVQFLILGAVLWTVYQIIRRGGDKPRSVPRTASPPLCVDSERVDPDAIAAHLAEARLRFSSSRQFCTTTIVGGDAAASDPPGLIIKKRLPSGETS